MEDGQFQRFFSAVIFLDLKRAITDLDRIGSA